MNALPVPGVRGQGRAKPCLQPRSRTAKVLQKKVAAAPLTQNRRHRSHHQAGDMALRRMSQWRLSSHARGTARSHGADRAYDPAPQGRFPAAVREQQETG